VIAHNRKQAAELAALKGRASSLETVLVKDPEDFIKRYIGGVCCAEYRIHCCWDVNSILNSSGLAVFFARVTLYDFELDV